MSGYEERTIRTITVTLSKSKDTVTATFYEPVTGDTSRVVVPYSTDEHPEFNERVGNELYWWIDEYVKTHPNEEG